MQFLENKTGDLPKLIPKSHNETVFIYVLI